MPVSPSTPISTTHLNLLPGIARQAILCGLEQGNRDGERWQPCVSDYPAPLQAIGTSFVTLTLDGKLRGCIGSIDLREPLVSDVARHGHAAAFSDHRFAPLQPEEYPALQVHVSVLSAPVALPASLAEGQLAARLMPHQDGLILECHGRRAVFLPSVWQQLPDPGLFIRALKRKGGWPEDQWPERMQAKLFRVAEATDAPAPKC